LLGLLFILLFAAFIGLWRRVSGGRMGGFMPPAGGPPPPPPPQGIAYAPPSSPMSVICKHCGKSIDLTTSKRPIEVMCPNCGETQLVA
jgi:DNA-directed RNA polymerase subunit RPC12/RpoP